MKTLLKVLAKAIQFVCVVAVVILLGSALVLSASGTIPGRRWEAAFRVLREGTPAPVAARAPSVEEEWRKIGEARERMERTDRARREEIRKVRDMARLDLLRMDQERKRLAKERTEAYRVLERLALERAALKKEKRDEGTEANLPIYSKMRGRDLADLMYAWPDPEIVRYLRLFPPRKAAEILREMKADPKYSQEGEGGTPSRWDRINEALRRAG